MATTLEECDEVFAKARAAIATLQNHNFEWKGGSRWKPTVSPSQHVWTSSLIATNDRLSATNTGLRKDLEQHRQNQKELIDEITKLQSLIQEYQLTISTEREVSQARLEMIEQMQKQLGEQQLMIESLQKPGKGWRAKDHIASLEVAFEREKQVHLDCQRRVIELQNKVIEAREFADELYNKLNG